MRQSRKRKKPEPKTRSRAEKRHRQKQKAGARRGKKPETETRSGAEKRHRQKHETGARSGKQLETETRSGAENRHRQKHETGASALQNPKGAILKAMRKTGALNFQKQPGITPYDRARRKTAKKPRPKQAEIDRSGQKTAKTPKTKPQFHRLFMRQMVSGITVRNALIPASNKMRIYGTASFRTCKPAEFARTPFFFIKSR